MRAGELDLVAWGHGQVVFIEVKTRSSSAFGSPASAVTATKQRRIRRLAAQWLQQHPSARGHIRFDVVAVVGGHIEVTEEAF